MNNEMKSGKTSTLVGGGGRQIPKYNGDLNDPAVTREQKASKSVHHKDKVKMDQAYDRIHPQPDPPQPMMQMTVMDNIMGDGKPAPKAPSYIYPSSTIPMPNPNNPVASNYMIPWNHNQLNVPIIKKYNISVQGMDGNITNTSQIFEDILPETNMALNRMTTLDERKVLHSYIRSILLKRGDGEQVSFNDKKPELINLLSHLKMLEINPYHFSRLTNVPHKTLADNFIMFRSCYPIRFDKKSNNISCAVDNIGANIRVYSMSVYDQMAQIINNGSVRKIFSDVWREIMFYTYIREEILKKNICPHFLFLHTYYITENNSIDFDKLKDIKYTTDIKSEEFALSNKKIKKKMFKDHMQGIMKSSTGIDFTIDIDAMPKTHENDIIKFNNLHKRNVRMIGTKTVKVDDEEYDINSRGTQCVVAITEAPDQNIVDWSTRTYVIEESAVRRQVVSGHHSELTWKTIIFQLLYTYATMFKHNIAIRDFEWGKNMFIKTFNDTGNIGYWRYNVNNMEYYIPNMKAIVMIDSCFDPVQNGYKDESGLSQNFNFKLEGDFYDTPKTFIDVNGLKMSIQQPDMDKLYMDIFKKMFDDNEFRNTFQLYGGIEPSPDIKLLMKKIYNIGNTGTNMTTDKLSNMFIVCFGEFMHNKVGDIVDQTDLQQLHNPGYDVQNCTIGELVAYNNNVGMNAYEWAIVSEIKPQTMKILIKKNDLYTTIDINRRQIRRVFGTITQKYKPEQKISSFDEVLSSYKLFI